MGALDFDMPPTVVQAIADGVPVLMAFRTWRGQGIDNLAAASGVSAERIREFEAGAKCSEQEERKIADALNIPVEVLVNCF